jgi:hypothetical protein
VLLFMRPKKGAQARPQCPPPCHILLYKNKSESYSMMSWCLEKNFVMINK